MKEERIIVDSSKRLNTTIDKIRKTISDFNISKDTKLIFIVMDEVKEIDKLKRVEQMLNEELEYKCEVKSAYIAAEESISFE